MGIWMRCRGDLGGTSRWPVDHEGAERLRKGEVAMARGVEAAWRGRPASGRWTIGGATGYVRRGGRSVGDGSAVPASLSAGPTSGNVSRVFTWLLLQAV